jgi:hypothetical protein
VGVVRPELALLLGDDATSTGAPNVVSVRRSTLAAIALVSLSSFALLASLLAHDHALYGFEPPLVGSLGSPAPIGSWGVFADRIGPPAIVAVLALAFAFGLLRRSLLRVTVFAGLAAATFLTSEHVAKPIDHETIAGHLSFPSGRVTAVCATAVAMWIALYPQLGRWARRVTFLLGVAWVLLMSLAVVAAHWHTTFDALGSVLLSLGIVALGGAAYGWLVPGESTGPTSSRTGDDQSSLLDAEVEPITR